MIRATFQPKIFQLALLVALTGLMIAAGLGLISMPSLLPGSEAHAAGTINVTTTVDEYDTSGSGSGCSLREAVESINTSTSFGGCSNPGNAADTIQLQAMTYMLSITETSPSPFSNADGSLNPQKSVTIRGTGAGQSIITTTSSFNAGVLGIFSDVANVDFIIEGLTIQGGKASDYVGGGIFIFGSYPTIVTLNDVIIENNKTTGINRPGGGLYCQSSVLLHLNNVTVRNNQTLKDNGGGVSIVGCNTTLTNVTISGNQASGSGGGIFFSNYGGSSTIQMTNVTIYDNQAQTSGGGLYTEFFWGNEVVITATNTTIANNRVISGSGGNIYNNASTLSLKNTIIANGLANGSANNCGGNPVPNITSLGYNLDSGNTCGLTATGDITNTNPLLAASLADNGGATETLALLTGSPAINNGTCSGAPATDQRGVARPQGAGCDIGAYEAETQGGPTSHWVHLPLIWKD